MHLINRNCKFRLITDTTYSADAIDLIVGQHESEEKCQLQQWRSQSDLCNDPTDGQNENQIMKLWLYQYKEYRL